MTDASERSRLPLAALGFGLAAALSSWNPLAAPFGLVVGVVALGLSVRAMRRAGRRRIAVAALAASVVAIVASAVVLALTAGVGRELGGTPVVQTPGRADVERDLGEAGERTRAARDRARRELDALESGADRAPPRPDR
jgi:predicted PurR-regulated permease PerM